MSLFLHRPEAANRKTTILFRLAASVPPLIAAAFVHNIDNVLTWCGLFALQIAFTFPAVLQYASIKHCQEVLGASGHMTRYTGAFSGIGGIIAGLIFSMAALIFVIISSIRDLEAL
jgi:hypothetical protein